MLAIAMTHTNLLREIEGLLRDWSITLNRNIETSGCYLFGSLIYDDGKLFDPVESDIDLVIIFPPKLSAAPERTNWLDGLLKHKTELETELLKLTGRGDAGSPIASILPITMLELEANIHKSNGANFYSINLFRNLLEQQPDGPLLHAGSTPIRDDLICTAFAFTQNIRNKFLSIAPNKNMALPEWQGPDPVPKDVMRHAAMAHFSLATDSKPGTQFDLQIGLDHLTDHLYQNRSNSQDYYSLYDWVSKRRGSRGGHTIDAMMPPLQYTLLAEVIYDLANNALKRGLFLHSDATFTVSDLFELAGSYEDIVVTIEEASHNVKWQIKPAFSVSFEAQINEPPQKGNSTTITRREKVRLNHAQNLFSIKKTIIERGIELIILYQNYLFPNSTTRNKNLIISINGLLKRAIENYVGSGGILAATTYYKREQAFTIKFSIPHDKIDELLESCGLEKNIMDLAANNQPLRSLEPELLARHFVPDMVFNYVWKTQKGHMSLSETDEDYMFNIVNWSLGVS